MEEEVLRGALSKVTDLPSNTFMHSRGPQEKVGRLSFPHHAHSEKWEQVSFSSLSTKLTDLHHPIAVESQVDRVMPPAVSWQDYASCSLSVILNILQSSTFVVDSHFL